MQDKEIKKIADSVLSKLKLVFPKFSKDLTYERNDWCEHIIHYKGSPTYYLTSGNYNNAIKHFTIIFTNYGLLNSVCKLKRKK